MENKDVAFIKFNDLLDAFLQQTQKEVTDFESGALSEPAARVKIGQRKMQAQFLQMKLQSVRTYRPTMAIENRVSPALTTETSASSSASAAA